MKNTQAIVLAAGKSTRFNTGTSKLLQKICGQEMILHATTLLERLEIPTTLVVGYMKDAVIKTVTSMHEKRVNFVEQKEQLGTGHALLYSRPHWNNEQILVINGDMPLINKEIIENLYEKHISSSAAISFVTAHNSDPAGYSYGRVIQNNGTIEIVEAKHFDGDHHEHCLVNAGAYIVSRAFLENAIDNVKQNEKSKEFYITDLVKIASDQKKTVATTVAPFDLIRGVNDLQELWAAEQIKRSELIKSWMSRGVRFTMPQAVHLDVHASIGAGTTIGGGAHLAGNSTIGKNCTIGAFSTLTNVTVGDNTTIHPHCVICSAQIGTNAQIGPFAHVYEKSVIKNDALICSFSQVTPEGVTLIKKECPIKNIDTKTSNQSNNKPPLFNCSQSNKEQI